VFIRLPVPHNAEAYFLHYAIISYLTYSTFSY